MIHIGRENVVRKAAYGYVGLAGMVRPMYDGWCGVAGARRRFMGGKITVDMIQKLELVPTYLALYQIDSDGYLTNPRTVDIKSAADLNAYSSYGSVTVDASARSITVKGNTRGYMLYLQLNMYLTWKTGARELFDEDLIAKLDNPKFTANFYVSISGSGAYGMYENRFCSVDCGIGSFNNSASKTLTAAPEWYDSSVAAGIQSGSATQTTTLTVKDFTIGGVQMLPKIAYY